MNIKKSIFFLSILLFCVSSCSRQQMKHIGEEYTGENIVVSEENKFFEYTAKFISINKTPFVAYLNKDTLDLGERQPTYCFDSLGRPVLFTECLSSYCSNLSELLAGNYTVNRYPMTIWINKNSSIIKPIKPCVSATQKSTGIPGTSNS